MNRLRSGITMSLDGYVAGPEQSVENPLGIGGMRLHEWAFALAAWREQHGLEGGEENASSAFVEESLANVGAVLMGRNMFGGGSGPWGDEPWPGWWGENPPFHVPVFVLTHHARNPLPLEGGTTFTFVTDGVESAIAQAKEAAAGRDVQISGGSTVACNALAAGLVDEIRLDLVPVLLGAGVRLFDDVSADLEQISVTEGRGVTHLTYRVARR